MNCFFTDLGFHSKHWEGNEKRDVGYFFGLRKGPMLMLPNKREKARMTSIIQR